jgi:hypothetical protein
MDYGIGIRTKNGRCFGYYIDWRKCLFHARDYRECGDTAVDYMECLHRRKEVCTMENTDFLEKMDI